MTAVTQGITSVKTLFERENVVMSLVTVSCDCKVLLNVLKNVNIHFEPQICHTKRLKVNLEGTCDRCR